MAKVDKRTVLKSMVGALATIQFEPAATQLFVSRIDDFTLGWLGLNITTNGGLGTIGVGPIVGVHNESVERLLAELLQEAPSVLAATVSRNIGYLAPANTYWELQFDGNAAENTARRLQIVKLVESLGLPFMEKHRVLPSIAATLDDGGKMNENIALRLPVVHRLMGREPEALSVIEIWEGRLASRQDPAAERYRRFADAFRRTGSQS